MDDPILEELVEKALEPLGEVVATPSGIAETDAVENFPDGDGGETNPSSAIESRKAATRGSGLGRIISDTTLASRSHASGSVARLSRRAPVLRRPGSRAHVRARDPC